jgi:hypothetical protein
MQKMPRAFGERLLWWVLYLLGWVLTSGLAFWLILQLRINLIDLNNFLGWGPWLLIAVDKFGLVLLGLAWLIGVFIIEMYLRASQTLRLLLQRLLRVSLVVGIALAFSYALQWLLV